MKLSSLKGFGSTSLHDILEASGTSKGGFYNHFKSKEDLFFQVLGEARKIWRLKNLDGLEQIENAVEKIERLLKNYRDRYLKDSLNFPGGCLFITLSVELNDQNPVLFKEINKGFIGLKKMIHRTLEDGQQQKGLKPQSNIDTVTEIIFNGMLGASVCYSAGKSATDLDNSIGALLSYIETLKR